MSALTVGIRLETSVAEMFGAVRSGAAFDMIGADR